MTISWHIEKRKVASLKEWGKNPRNLTAKGLDKLTESINKFGLAEPIVINTDGTICGGHGRKKVLTANKIKECDCYVPDRELTEDEFRELNIRLNANIAGEWDWDMLANEWEAEELNDWGLEVPNIEEVIEAREDDFEGVAPKDPLTVLGDLYEMNDHRLLCGDSTCSDTVSKLMNGEKADMLTDPPYGIDINMNMGRLKGRPKKFEEKDWDKSVPDFFYLLDLFENKIIWGGNYFADKLPVTKDWLCWFKKTKGLDFAEFELAWSNTNKNARLLEHHWSGEKKLHPTMKPIPVIAWCLGYLNSENIFDPFLGSGSTMIACDQLNRKCYGMELDPKYCDVIVARFINHRKLTGGSLVIKRNGRQLSDKEMNKYISNTSNG